MTNPPHPPTGVEAYKEILIELHNERILELSHQTGSERNCALCGHIFEEGANVFSSLKQALIHRNILSTFAPDQLPAEREIIVTCKGCPRLLCESCVSRKDNYCRECSSAFYGFYTCLKQLARRSTKPGKGLSKGQNRLLAVRSSKSYCEANNIILEIIRELQSNIHEALVKFPRGPKESRRVVGIINKHTKNCGVVFEAEDNRWEPRFNMNDPIGTVYCALFKVLEYDISDVHLCKNNCGRFFVRSYRRLYCGDKCKDRYRKKK